MALTSAPASTSPMINLEGVHPAAATLFLLDKQAAEAGATIVRSGSSVSYTFPRPAPDDADKAIIGRACDGFLATLQEALQGSGVKIERTTGSPRITKQ